MKILRYLIQPDKESYILGDFNINLYHNGKYAICKINEKKLSNSKTNSKISNPYNE